MFNNQNIKLVRKLNWEEVFCFWYENEGKRENWIELAKKRGFASWAEWRLNAYAIRFECRSADWGLYEISNPAETAAKFYGGPFKTWVERHYNKKETMSFSELAKLPKIKEQLAVKAMVENFPQDKIITCLALGNKIFTIEGMHRSCALAVMNQKGKDLILPLRFAIGISNLKKLPVAGRID